MRLAFHRQMAPLGAHPQDAKYLKVSHLHQQNANITSSYWKDKFHNKNSNPSLKLSKSPTPSAPKKPSNPNQNNTSLLTTPKIPSNLDSSLLQLTAPENETLNTTSTDIFHTVLRNKKKKYRKAVLSPKSYYEKKTISHSTESTKSVFTQYSKFLVNRRQGA